MDDDGISGVDLGWRRGLTGHAGLQISLRAQPRRDCLQKADWKLVRDLGPQAPTYRRRAGVLYDHIQYFEEEDFLQER